MISFIKGHVDEVSETAVVLENNGIGYRVQVSPQTIARLPGRDVEVKLHTYMQMTDAGVALYGFLDGEEISIFNLLILVSGVGPKVALGVLGVMEPRQIILAIITEDFATLSKAPGVGKKTAQRIVLELKDRLKTHDAVMTDTVEGRRNIEMSSNEKQDAIDALLALGYSRGEGVKAVMETALPGMDSGSIIKSALRKLAKHG